MGFKIGDKVAFTKDVSGEVLLMHGEIIGYSELDHWGFEIYPVKLESQMENDKMYEIRIGSILYISDQELNFDRTRFREERINVLLGE